VAVKVLNASKVDSEPYRRFAREVEQLRRLGDFPGILPILDANVPADLAKGQRAWLAMPVAKSIGTVLGPDPTLATVVAAAATIANTLARLAEEGISHRDIKPDNLFRYDEQWVIGDFGLVKVPDAEPITAGARKLGPIYFLAPEMLNSPAEAKGEPADVYSLAKTLWVLVTGDRFPPPGEHRLDIPGLRLSTYVEHLRMIYLDRLLERATQFEPTRRPSMREMANELAAWGAQPAAPTAPLDIAEITAKIATTLEPARRVQAAHLERHRLTTSALEAFSRRAEASIQALLNSGLPIVQKLSYDTMVVDTVLRNQVIVREEFSLGSSVIVGRRPPPLVSLQPLGTGPDFSPVLLWAGFGLKTTADGKAFLAAGYVLGRDVGVAGVIWGGQEEALLGSAQQEEAVVALCAALHANLPAALQRLLEALERS